MCLPLRPIRSRVLLPFAGANKIPATAPAVKAAARLNAILSEFFISFNVNSNVNSNSLFAADADQRKW